MNLRNEVVIWFTDTNVPRRYTGQNVIVQYLVNWVSISSYENDIQETETFPSHRVHKVEESLIIPEVNDSDD